MNIFLDIDGTLLEQFQSDDLQMMLDRKPKVLPGVLAKLDNWHFNGYNVILTSARPEGARQRTIEQLNDVGIYHYSKLILGLNLGTRILINDFPTGLGGRAIAYPIERNKGIGNINV